MEFKRASYLRILVATALVLIFGCGSKSSLDSEGRSYKYENPDSGKVVSLRPATDPTPLNKPAAVSQETTQLQDANILLDRKGALVTVKVTRNLYDDNGALRSTDRITLTGKFEENKPTLLRDVDAKQFGGPRLLGFAECVADRWGQACATLFVNVIYDAENNFKQFHAVFPGRQSGAKPGSKGANASSPVVAVPLTPTGSAKSGSSIQSGALPATGAATQPGAAPGTTDQTGSTGSPTPVTTGSEIETPTDDPEYETVEVIDDGSKPKDSHESEFDEGASPVEESGSGSFVTGDATSDWEEVKTILPNPYVSPKRAQTSPRSSGTNSTGTNPWAAPGASASNEQGRPETNPSIGGRPAGTRSDQNGGKNQNSSQTGNAQSQNGQSQNGRARGGQTQSGQDSSASPSSGRAAPSASQYTAPAAGPATGGQPQTSTGIPLRLTGGGTSKNSHENGYIENVGTLFPTSSPGARRASADGRAYGNGFSVEFMEQTTRQFTMANPECGTLVFNQISKASGGFLRGHKTHYNGLDFDISIFGNPGTHYAHDVTVKQKNSRTGRTRYVKIGKLGPARNFPYGCFLKYTKYMYDQKFKNVGGRVEGTELVDLIWVNEAIQKDVCQYVKNNNLKDQYAEAMSLIYPWSGHTSHFHVRLRCSPKHNGCYARDLDRRLPYQKRGCRNL